MSKSSRLRYVSSPEDAAQAFYEAFEKGDLEAMMAAWAEDEEVVCVHPGSHPLVGYAAVRAAWKSVFESSPQFRFELADVVWYITGTMATQSCVEWIRLGDEVRPRGAVAATNTFIRTIHGWRMLSHHGSPIAQAHSEVQVTIH